MISQLFVVDFVHPTYIQIALIWGFTVQPSLWKLVYLLWKYKLNEVCDNYALYIRVKKHLMTAFMKMDSS